MSASLDELTETGENPIKVVRRLSGLSMRQAAIKIGCHYQTVYMAEHAMFVPIPPTMLYWAVSVSPWGVGDIESAYEAFQYRRRQESWVKHSTHTLTVSSLGLPDGNPVRNLREFLHLTQSGFCKEFCIPVSWLYDVENRALSFPQRLRSVMGLTGIPEEVLQEIHDRLDAQND